MPAEDAEDKNPLKLDDYVLEQVQLALKLCKDKIDTEFYASAESYLVKKAEPQVVEEEATQEEVAPEEVAAEEAPVENEQQEAQ